ncbi:MAG: acyl-CoA dehydrogenase family protein [Tetrasphaera sp.]|nr:acyl-CoA dehydrogenase family protein [Tetrasphaera sp.]
MRRDLFDADHEAYRSSIRAFLEAKVVPHYDEWRSAGIVPRELFTDLGALGALGWGVPEEFGGAGVDDFRYNLILAEEAARLHVSPALLGPGLVVDIVMPYLVGLGTPEQQARWLPDVVAGRTITAVAMTEPGTGSDLAGISTRAVLEGDEWVLNGAKTFITNGINADLVVVAARTGEGRHDGLSLFVVERGMAGFERGRQLHKVGLHAQDTAELSFTDVRMPSANLLGRVGDGFAGLTRNLAQERLSAAAGAVAGAEAALALTVEHVRSRKAFGAPLGALQNTRFVLAELATEMDIARVYVDRCVRAHADGELTHVDAAKAKWWTTELHGRVVDAGLQLHGGYGYMDEYPIARAWTDARVQRIYAGANEVMKDLIGKSMKLA